MNKLFVVGDSFSAPPKEGDPFLPWYAQAAQQLNLNCLNFSGIGVSQDWCWWKLAQQMPTLTPDDQILIVLTHPGRFWFFDDKPQMTNPNIVNLDKELSPHQLEAVKNYMMYIQRPPLDVQFLSHRLGWLEAQIKVNKLKPAHVLCAFPLFIPETVGLDDHINWTQYENVIISKGDLVGCVETPECQEGIDEYKLWMGFDCRYNHMIQSNHKVLAEECARAISAGEPINLIEPEFVTKVLHYDIFDDEEFIRTELEPQQLIDRQHYIENNLQKPWAETAGIMDWWKRKKK